jgi:hypothetical protein
LCDVGGTGEFSIYEETIDIKDEKPEAILFPPIRTEHEVRLWGVCEVVVTLAFLAIYCPQPKGNCKITLN